MYFHGAVQALAQAAEFELGALQPYKDQTKQLGSHPCKPSESVLHSASHSYSKRTLLYKNRLLFWGLSVGY